MPSSPNPLPATEQKQREQITGQIQIPSLFAEQVRKEVQNLAQFQETLTKTDPNNITTFLQTLLIASLSLDASDIHIEPEKKGVKIRLRIDGLLHDVTILTPHIYQALLSRIKLVARIKLNVSDKPQDGRFSFTAGQNLVEARISTLPTEYGETVVLRILNPKNLMEIDELGLRPEILKTIRKELKRPNGMIMATGPTGSGKTTTLYAFLKEVSSPEIKIITIEDPIEYHLAGVSQTQIHPEKGYDFASGLQAIVRQDPDIILVGEIRDKTTAQLALQAALTGHLVFSTLHTNDAPGTISRLISLGAKRVNIGAASGVIIGQRLVRKACTHCTTFTKVTAPELTQIKKGLQGIKEVRVPILSPALKLARPTGCVKCNTTGYKGRLGLFEVIFVNSAMEEFILTKPSTAALRKFAIQQGMTPLYQDGLLKVLKGILTLEELNRAAGEEKI